MMSELYVAQRFRKHEEGNLNFTRMLNLSDALLPAASCLPVESSLDGISKLGDSSYSLRYYRL